ncbi:MAG TPA: DoxX family membrane protein [Gemmataceae bacterium]|jgi:uncharacterized membrane protein YphA (DoxX/SURF4 family)
MRIALLLCRLIVALAFITYGLVKILGGQFYHGDWVIDSRTTDPTSLVWCFFGYSPVYARLIGLGEFIPGLLLLFPRTKTLGALALLPVTLNITVMDFCFGFPAVKYTSLWLSILTVTLVASDYRKLRPIFWDDARVDRLDRLEQQTAADPSRAAVPATPATRPRLTWIVLGVMALVLLVPLGNLIAINVTPGPEKAALAHCVAEGWNESELSVRKWRRTRGDWGFGMEAEVEIAAGDGDRPTVLRVRLRRPNGGAAWQAVGVERAE